MHFDTVIVGGGPAGASCAIWLKQLGFEPCLVEREARLGGLQNESPYPNRWIAAVSGRTGTQVAAEIADNVASTGVECLMRTAVRDIVPVAGGFEVDCGRQRVTAPVVVLASGVRPRSGGWVRGPRVIVGPGHAVMQADVLDRRVAILGGGDNAFENYLFLRDRGAREVRIFARTVRARGGLRRQVPADALHLGDYRCDTARREIDGEPFDLVVVLYGWTAEFPFAQRLGLACTPSGFVITDADCQTSRTGVYAAGEVAARSHPCCATSMADGVVAAKAIQRRLEKLAA